MENDLLRNQLQNTRNLLNTLAGNIDNTLLIYNDLNRNRYRERTNAARRNLNNLFQELRNMYPETNRNTTPNTQTPGNNVTSNYTPLSNSLNNIINNRLNNRLNNLNSTSHNPLNPNLSDSNPLNPNLSNSNPLNSTSPLNTHPDLIEVTLYNSGHRVASNSSMEDVQIYPSLRTLRESSTVHMYGNLETEYDSCSICRDRFDDNSIVRKLYCNHIFHLNCIDTWLEGNIRCPVCRSDLRDVEDDSVNLSNTTGNLSNTHGNLSNTTGNLSNTNGNLSNTTGNLSNTHGNLSNTNIAEV
jgi:hypothetical protein